MFCAYKRWICLAAAMVTALLIGVLYSWSVFVTPLAARYGWSTASISVAYSINMLAMMVTPFLGNRFRNGMPLSRYALWGSLLYSAGLMLCSCIQSSVYELYLYFGIMVGGGQGVIYMALISYVILLFPDKKGLAAGLFTASYGCAAFFWAPAALAVIQATGDVGKAFLYLGAFFLAGLAISTRFLVEVPPAASPAAGAKATDAAVSGRKKWGLTPRETLASPQYYMLLTIFTCGKISGAVVLALGSPILQTALHCT